MANYTTTVTVSSLPAGAVLVPTGIKAVTIQTDSAAYQALQQQLTAGEVPATRAITAGTGLTGGGDLSANRSLAVAFGTTAGTAAQGNDSRITGAAQAAANLSDLASATTARTNLGLGDSATHPASDFVTRPATPTALGQVPGYDSAATNTIRWFTTQEHVALALGWAIVTDSRFSGGAKGDSTTDDTAAITAAVNSLTKGGTVWFPPGYYKVTSTISVTKPIQFAGSRAGYDGSGIGAGIMTTSGVSAFLVSSPNVEFSRLMFLANTNEGTSIANQTYAIKFTAGGGDRCVVEKCSFQYYYIDIWFTNGQLWTVNDNVFHNNSGYGVFISNPATPDGGDQKLSFNTFQSGTATTGTYSSGGASGANTIVLTAAPTVTIGSSITGTGIAAGTSVSAVAGSTITLSANLTAQAAGTYTFDNWGGIAQVHQESGGGTRVVSNKFIGGPIGYQVAPADGIGTTILPISANSFELHTFAHIHFTNGGPLKTGTFGRVQITGNEFTSTNVSQASIYCDTTSAQISEVNIGGGNTFVGVGGTTIFVRTSNVSGVTLVGNYFKNGSQVFFGYGGTSRVLTTPNNVENVNGAWYRWDGNSSSASSTPVLMENVKNFLVTSNSTYSQIFGLTFNAIGSCTLDVDVIGNLSGGTGGALAGTFRRLVSLGTLGTACTVTTVGTDPASPVPFDILFDTTTNNQVFIKIKRNTADGGTQIQGAMRARAFGAQQQI